MFEIKGNKSTNTIICESMLRGIAHMNCFACWPEVSVDKGKIDFVLGRADGEDINRMHMDSATGIELKVSWSDFCSGNGRHVFSYHYNYFLVPEEMVYKVQKYIEKNVEYDHVGILVVTDEYTLEIARYAKFIPFSNRSDQRLKDYENDTYIIDGVTQMLTSLGRDGYVAHCYDMKNSCDFTYDTVVNISAKSEYVPFNNNWSESDDGEKK